MWNATRKYVETLIDRFGAGWNQFWYAPTDPFPLAAMRVAVGLVALYQHATWFPDLVQFFGSDGLVTVESVQMLRRGIGWSYLNGMTTPGELYSAHVIGGIVLVLFTIGLWTRITSVAALVVVLAYVHRAPALTSQVDVVLPMVMFYLCLGPSGACLSLDAWWKRGAEKEAAMLAGRSADHSTPRWSATIAVRLLQVHVAAVYLMSALEKLNGSDVWWDGQATWYLLVRPDTHLFDLTESLAGHPYVLDAMTHAIVWYEFAFALLVWNRTARPLMLALGVPIWLLMMVVTGNVPFCLLMLAANLAFFNPATLRAMVAVVPGLGSVLPQRAAPASA